MENIITNIMDLSKNGARFGVFLCQCGGKISSKVDLGALKALVAEDPDVAYVDTLPFPCLAPGLGAIREKVAENGLNRLVVAGCEYRLMLKKFENELLDMGLEEGQVDMVNLRDHVAAVNKGNPGELAVKGSKLIRSAVAGMVALIPSPKNKVEFKDPVMIVGAGMATYAAASELSRNGVDVIIAVQTEDIEDEIRMLHERYPGERRLHDRLRKIMEEVEQSPLIKRITVGELEKVRGVMGDYQVVFCAEGNGAAPLFKAGAIIAALDGEMQNQGSEFGHDGKRVLCQTEMEEHLWVRGIPDHRVVFWINDLETERPYAHLSTRTAWNMATYMREHLVQSKVTILYNDKIKLPLSAAERIRARDLNIRWVPYDGSVRPTVQSGFITCTDPETQVEREIPGTNWSFPPNGIPGLNRSRWPRCWGCTSMGMIFLSGTHRWLHPEQVGSDEKFLAGSARQPCDLEETLRQGRRAAKRIAEIVNKSKAGELFAPRMVCRVDQSKCIGCGLCHEICDCGGIAPVDGPGGNIPRIVDPWCAPAGEPVRRLVPTTPWSCRTIPRPNARQGSQPWRERSGTTRSCLSGATGEVRLRPTTRGSRVWVQRTSLHAPRRLHRPIGSVVMGRAFLDGAEQSPAGWVSAEECHHSYVWIIPGARILLIKKLLSLAGLEGNANLSRPHGPQPTRALHQDGEHLCPGDGPVGTHHQGRPYEGQAP